MPNCSTFTSVGTVNIITQMVYRGKHPAVFPANNLLISFPNLTESSIEQVSQCAIMSLGQIQSDGFSTG